MELQTNEKFGLHVTAKNASCKIPFTVPTEIWRFNRSVCGFCGMLPDGGIDGLLDCESCYQEVFCSNECRKLLEDIHRIECGIYTRILNTRGPKALKDLNDTPRIFFRIYSYLGSLDALDQIGKYRPDRNPGNPFAADALEAIPFSLPGPFDSTMMSLEPADRLGLLCGGEGDLVRNTGADSVFSVVQVIATIFARYQDLHTLHPRHIVLSIPRVIGAYCMNTYGMEKGTYICVGASMFNHSRAPTHGVCEVLRRHQAPRIRIDQIVERDLEPGEQCFILYNSDAIAEHYYGIE